MANERSNDMSISNQTWGLEGKYFCDPGIFERETDRIFATHWLCLARIEDFGKSPQAAALSFQIGNFPIAVVKKADGELKAFHNVCRHRGAKLVDQEYDCLRNSHIVCPYHAWSYDLDGHLVGAPNMPDENGCDRTELSLLPIGCENWGGFVLINLRNAQGSFISDLQPLVQRLAAWHLDRQELACTLTYDVRANWKLLFQNYSECYHCPIVHPALNRLTPYKTATNDLTDGPILGGPMTLADGCQTVSVDGKSVGPVFPGLDERQRRSVYYYTVFPNWFVSAHPDYVMVHHIERVASDRSRVHCHFLAAPGTDRRQLARAIDQWDEINRQDWRVCELTQCGIESPAYVPGPYTPLESMSMAFDRHYRAAMASRTGIA